MQDIMERWASRMAIMIASDNEKTHAVTALLQSRPHGGYGLNSLSEAVNLRK